MPINPLMLGQGGAGLAYGLQPPRQGLQQQLPQRGQGPAYGDAGFSRSATGAGIMEALSNPIQVESGGWGEAIAEALSAGLRGRTARDERQREIDVETRQQKMEDGQRMAISQALAAYQNAGDDPNAQHSALVTALAGGAPEQALELATGRTGQRLEMADGLQLERDRTPILADRQRQVGDIQVEQGVREARETFPYRFNPNTGGGAYGTRGSPLERAQATADVDRLEALNAQADTDMATMAELDRFVALNAQTDTNPTNLQAIGIGSWRPLANDDTQEMGQIISRLTPQQRVPGSGATSDFDARMFTDALPGLQRSREANQAIAGAYRVRSQLSRERAEFAADWLDQEGNLRQFDAEWRRYVEANPIFDRQSTPDNPILNTRRQDFGSWYAQRSGSQEQAPTNDGTGAPQPRVRIWNPNTGRLE